MKPMARAQFKDVTFENRPSSGARGYGRKWQKYSQWRLSKFPLCVICNHAAQATDHIQPVTGPDDPLFWDPTNHQSLCWSCHSRKTGGETNGKQIRGTART